MECLDTARALLKTGASLQEAAQAAGFARASDLDQSLWFSLGRECQRGERRGTGRLTPAKTPTPPTRARQLELDERMQRRFTEAKLSPAEIADACLFIANKGYRVDEAIGIVVRSRRQTEAAAT